jgi:SAM-dependent methyltransferase
MILNCFELEGIQLVEPLGRLLWSFEMARVIHVANSLDIFTMLAEAPASAEELSVKCRAKAGMMEKLLIACTALGLLERKNGTYQNTLVADLCLVRGNPLYQGHAIVLHADEWNDWSGLEKAVRDESAEKSSGDLYREYIFAMHNFAVAGQAQWLANNVSLEGRQRLLDVGGGPGTHSIALCQRYPALQAVVFDLPQAIAVAEEIIAQFGMTERIAVRPGSWDEDEFGEGYDVVLLSNVLHGPSSKADGKLSKVYRALVSGGLLIIHDALLDNDKSGPLFPALFNLMVGAYSVEELLACVMKAGFVKAKLKAVARFASQNSLIVAEKP